MTQCKYTLRVVAVADDGQMSFPSVAVMAVMDYQVCDYPALDKDIVKGSTGSPQPTQDRQTCLRKSLYHQPKGQGRLTTSCGGTHLWNVFL